MKIVHFSDPHAGGWPSSGSAFFDKRIIGALNYNFRRRKHFKLDVLEHAVNHILAIAPQVAILTGDITSIGDPAEFKLAMQILAPLVNSSIRLFYVPGNHDCYVNDSKCKAMLHEAFHYLNQNRTQLNQLPQANKIQNLNFIQLNQAMPRNLIMSDGLLDQASIDLINSPRMDNEIRIVLGHFPTCDASKKPLIVRRQLRNYHPLQNALKNGNVNLYLCGHIHRPFIVHYSQSMEICAGSITANGHLNILEINQIEDTITQHWEVIGAENNEPNLHNFELIANLNYPLNNNAYCNLPLNAISKKCHKNLNKIDHIDN